MNDKLKKILAKGLKRGYLLKSELMPYNQEKNLIIEQTYGRACIDCDKKQDPVYGNDQKATTDREMKVKILQALTTGTEKKINFGLLVCYLDHYKACESCPVYVDREKNWSNLDTSL